MAITLDGSNGILSPDFEPSSSTLPTNGLYLPSANTLGLATNGTGKAFLDSAGNLGLGVTPSGWSPGVSKAVQLSTGSLYTYSTDRIFFGQNVYINSSNADTYIATAPATTYRQYSGTHAWYTAPSGTAGNAISFTQAMTLSAAGGLSVGTTSDAGAGNIWAVNSLYVGDGSLSNNAIARAAGTGTGIYFPAANSIGFTTNATERARIDAGGFFFRCAGGAFTSGQSGWQLRADTGTIQLSNSGTTQSYVAYFYNGNGTVGTISTSGSATTYSTSSDQRLKDDIGVATDTSVIDSTIVHDFSWKTDGTIDRGVFSQEALLVKPSAVSKGESDELNEHGLPVHPWGVDYSKYVPDLIVYCQQLKARIEALEAK